MIEKPESPVDRSEGDTHPLGNPHYYLDPGALQVVAKNLADRFSRLDPPHAPDYKLGAERFNARMEEAWRGWRARLKPFEGRPVAAYHKNMQYFFHWSGLKSVGFVEPKAGIPPGARYLNDLAERLKKEGVRVIFYQPYYDASLCERVAEKSGAKAVLVPGETGGVPESKDVFTNFEALVSAVEKYAGK